MCILLNYGGRNFAEHARLPLWLDSFGTVLCAYVGGPVCGAITGVSVNLIYGMINHVSYVYSVTSIALALITGLAARKGKLEYFFGTITVSTQAALISIAISVPLSFFYYNGGIGNLWGDGVANYFKELGYPKFVSVTIGQFYIDFVDKLLTFLLLFLLIRLARFLRRKTGQPDTAGKTGQPDTGSKAESLSSSSGIITGILVLLLLGASGTTVRAAESTTASVPNTLSTDSMAAGSTTESVPNAAASDNAAEDSSAAAPYRPDYCDYVQTVFNGKNGLPCGEANDIAQTTDGILWIGTYAGLYRYNGNEFRWMNDYESVHNVNALYVDDEGRLWIGTNDNGLSIAINGSVVNVLDQDQGLPSNIVRCIVQGSDGYYYIGTSSSMQVLALSGGLKKITAFKEINGADSIAADKQGHVVAVSSGGFLFLMKESRILSSLRLLSDTESFNCCSFDSSGRLLAGTTENNIHVYDISSGSFEEAGTISCEPLHTLNEIEELETGEFFITADNGLGYLDADLAFHNINVNDFNSSIDAVEVDYQGNLWFASSRHGLLRMSPSPFRDIFTTVGLMPRVVNAVTKWQGITCFGTDDGLSAVDEMSRSIVTNELTELLTGRRIRCLYTDSRNHLWIASYGLGLIEAEPDGTLYYYNHDTGTFGIKSRVVTELSDGTIAASGDAGLIFIRDHEVTAHFTAKNGLPDDDILSLSELADGRIAVGTDGSGIVMIEDGQVNAVIDHYSGLTSDVILRTVTDIDGISLFIVTSNGLCYMNESGSVMPLHNFPYFNNYDVWIKNDRTLFVTGSAGIHVVDREELLSGASDIRYDLLDYKTGLTSALTANSWNYDNGDGNLYLCGGQGAFIIDTDRYSAGERTYRMTITNVILDGTSFKPEKNSPIPVNRGISRIELVPEVVNYSIQDPFVGYYLEGFENQWTISPQSSLSSITYTNLPTGNYTFHLAVFDNEKEKILEERTYPLIKAKEIYDNRWFKFYLLIVAMLAVAWFTWFFVRTQVQRTLNMQKRELALAHQQIQMGNQTIMAIAKTVDAKDTRTSQHSYRVSEYAYMIGRELGYSEEECENLRKAAWLHDIGKIGIPDSILNKPSRLTDEEYAIMKTHTIKGGEVLKDFTLVEHVADGALYHHERYDGKGYPHGLKGEEIPVYGRIIGVADTFDAMTANRVYRKQMDFSYVLNELEKGKGTQFDPQMVDILLKLIREGKINLNELYSDISGKQDT